jgi:ketosteroid isomerase-like protein
MVTDADKKAIAQPFLAGLRSRDWSLLRSIMTEDIVWSLPGTSLISGEASGVDDRLRRGWCDFLGGNRALGPWSEEQLSHHVRTAQ